MRYAIPKPPRWLAEVAPDSALNARDVCALLGGITISCLSQRIQRGEFPAPDYHLTSNGNTHGHPMSAHREWYVRTVRRFFREQAL